MRTLRMILTVVVLMTVVGTVRADYLDVVWSRRAVTSQLIALAGYTNILSGNWSTVGVWSNSIAPAAGGYAGNTIVFSPATTDNSTNNLAGTFILNQLWSRANSIVNLAGNPIQFVSANSVNPSITNSGTQLMTIRSGIVLANDLTVGGSGAITIVSNISETAVSELIKNGANTLTLSYSNSFTGGTTLNAGTLIVGNNRALNGGTLTINGGSLSESATIYTLTVTNIVLNATFAHPNTAFDLNMGTGRVNITNQVQINTQHGLTFGGFVTGPNDLNVFDILIGPSSGNAPTLAFGAGATLVHDTVITNPVSATITYTGSITGDVGYAFTVSTNATVVMTGSNRIDGPVLITGGGKLQMGSGSSGTPYINPLSMTVNPGSSLWIGDGNLGTKGTVDPSVTITNNGTLMIGGITTAWKQGVHFGLITGTGTLQIAISGGHGGITLTNSNNSFTGPFVFFGDGKPILTFNSIGNIGGGTSAAGAPTTVAQGTFPLAGYTVTYNGAGDSSDRLWNINGNGSILASGTTTAISPFEITSSLYPSGASRILSLGGTGCGKVSGMITNSGAYTLSITKKNTGSWILSGDHYIDNLRVGYNTGASGSMICSEGSSLTIGNNPASSQFYVGVTAATGLLDLTLCSNLVANVQYFFVGESDVVNQNDGYGTVLLGTNSTITATSYIEFGGNALGVGNQVNLYGTVTTKSNSVVNLFTPALYLGWSKISGGWFVLNTNGVPDGSIFSLNGLSGARSLIQLGHQQNNGSGRVAQGTLDLSRGVADLYCSSIIVGQNASTVGAYGWGYIYLSTNTLNHLDVRGSTSPVKIGNSTSTGVSSGIMNIGGLDATSSITSTNNAVAIQIAGSTTAASGTLNLLGGTLTITTTNSAIDGGGGTSQLNLNNCTLKAGTNSVNWIADLTTATITNTVTFDVNSFAVTIPQPFRGNGSFIKAGTGTLTLSGTNTWSGNTITTNGVLSLTTNIALSASTTVYIANTATNNLNFTGTNNVTGLYTNNVSLGSGTWGSNNVSFLTGGGFLKVP